MILLLHVLSRMPGWCVPCMPSIVLPVTHSGTRRNAIVFLTLYLQLLGMNDAAASALMALFLGGSALGGLLGGWLGDKAAQASAQPGVVSLLPLCAFSLPHSSMNRHGSTCFSLNYTYESASERLLALCRGGQSTAASLCARPVYLLVSRSRFCYLRYTAMPVASAVT